MPARSRWRVQTLPVDAGTLHYHQFHLVAVQPGDQPAQTLLEAAELAGVLLRASVVLLDQDGRHLAHAMHIDARHASIQCLHLCSPTATLVCGSGADIRPVMPRTRLQPRPLYRSSCRQRRRYTRGYGPVGTGPVRPRGPTTKRLSTSRPRRSLQPQRGPFSQGFHIRGRTAVHDC